MFSSYEDRKANAKDKRNFFSVIGDVLEKNDNLSAEPLFLFKLSISLCRAGMELENRVIELEKKLEVSK
jgi:hypothetical protein